MRGFIYTVPMWRIRSTRLLDSDQRPYIDFLAASNRPSRKRLFLLSFGRERRTNDGKIYHEFCKFDEHAQCITYSPVERCNFTGNFSRLRSCRRMFNRVTLDMLSFFVYLKRRRRNINLDIWNCYVLSPYVLRTCTNLFHVGSIYFNLLIGRNSCMPVWFSVVPL